MTLVFGILVIHEQLLWRRDEWRNEQVHGFLYLNPSSASCHCVTLDKPLCPLLWLSIWEVGMVITMLRSGGGWGLNSLYVWNTQETAPSRVFLKETTNRPLGSNLIWVMNRRIPCRGGVRAPGGLWGWKMNENHCITHQVWNNRRDRDGTVATRRTTPWPLWLDLLHWLSPTFGLLDSAETSGFLLHSRGAQVIGSTSRSSLMAHACFSVILILNQPPSCSYGGSQVSSCKCSKWGARSKFLLSIPTFPLGAGQKGKIPFPTVLCLSFSVILQGPRQS